MCALFRGIAIGFAVAAPVGPVGLLCISRTLAFGPRIGFTSGLGAALADALYGALAAVGVSAITLTVRRLEFPLHVTGAIVLVSLGMRTIFSRAANAEEHECRSLSSHAAFLSTFGLTVVNPSTIVSFAAIVSAVGVSGRFGASAAFVCGVFAGSAFWWATLSICVFIAGKHVTARTRHLIAVGSGVVLATMGVLLLHA